LLQVEFEQSLVLKLKTENTERLGGVSVFSVLLSSLCVSLGD
jgi:hypothetical protein